MRRRRQALQVNTFPFLAVLLCTMGSFILLLLVIDRRAKAVARARAEQAVRLAAEADAKTAARAAADRKAEWELKRRELHALLALQEEELEGQLRAVAGQTAEAAGKVKAVQAQGDGLRQRLRAEETGLEHDRQELEARRAYVRDQAREQARKAEEMKESARKEATRLARELDQMEQVLVSLKALKRQEAPTYSVVPFFGSRGQDRRPLYVECAAGAVVFHPDRLSLAGPDLSPLAVRKELDRRLAAQQAADARASPYLLLLVRPNGIGTYYLLRTALAGLPIDYGYELIDREWVLDFASDKELAAAFPWQNARKLNASASGPKGGGTGNAEASSVGEIPPPPPGRQGGLPGAGGPGSVMAMPGVPIPGMPPSPYAGPATPGPVSAGRLGYPQAAGSGVPGMSGPGGAPAAPGGPPVMRSPELALAGQPDTRTGNPSWHAPAPNSSGSAAWQGGIPGGSSAPDVGVALAVPGQPAAAAPAGPPSLTAGGPDLPPPSGPAPSPGAGPSWGPATLLPPVPGGAPAQPGTQAPAGAGGLPRQAAGTPGLRTDGAEESAGQEGPAGQAQPAVGPLVGMLTGPGRRAPVPLGRLIGNRDWTIPVECRGGEVVVLSTGAQFPTATLRQATAAQHPLVAEVRQLIDRRQATVRPGEPPYRPVLRFRVYPDGLRSYYAANALLSVLHLPATRENVETEQHTIHDLFRP